MLRCQRQECHTIPSARQPTPDPHGTRDLRVTRETHLYSQHGPNWMEIRGEHERTIHAQVDQPSTLRDTARIAKYGDVGAQNDPARAPLLLVRVGMGLWAFAILAAHRSSFLGALSGHLRGIFETIGIGTEKRRVNAGTRERQWLCWRVVLPQPDNHPAPIQTRMALVSAACAVSRIGTLATGGDGELLLHRTLLPDLSLS